MATSSISGLASGLDTESIVKQLILLEAAPQTRLKTQLTKEQTARSALQGLTTQVAALADLAEQLAAPAGWRTPLATSSSADVAVSGTAGGPGGSFRLVVDSVAVAHRLAFTTTAAGTDVVVPGGSTLELTVGGKTTLLDTGDGTLNGVVDALNKGDTGVRASKVKLDDGSFRLVVTAAATGVAGGFTLTGAGGAPVLGGAAVTAGRDAAVTIGDDVIHSASNTFHDVVPGLSFTVSAKAVGTTVDIASTPDGTAVRERTEAFVTAVNAVLTRLDALTASSAETKGALAGDRSLRGLRDQLLTSIYPSGGGSLASLGVQSTRDGRLTFDGAAFAAAYAADPAAVEEAFSAGAGGGFADRVRTLAEASSTSRTGSLSRAISGRDESIGRLEDRIDDWDTRLELRRSTLTRQYTSLETALNQLSTQSNWLASQLSTTTT